MAGNKTIPNRLIIPAKDIFTGCNEKVIFETAGFPGNIQK